jgi:DUF971 family protein
MTITACPQAIVQRPDSLLLRWPEGDRVLSAIELRAACRCGPCRAAALQGRPWPADAALLLTQVEPIGGYALQLRFSDGHDRGIYPWALLYELSNV